MKHIFRVLIFLFTIHSAVFAQDSLINSSFYANLDSMVNLWYMQGADLYTYKERPSNYDSTLVPNFTNEEYKKRVSEMESAIPLTYNANVQAYINVYALKNRKKVEIMLGLAEYYFPMFEEILELQNVPQELKYLAIIESALNPRARSRVGAVGLWQFMPATGRMLKLEINSYIDERQDPIKSTYAAAEYLKSLHGMFDDWTLALAAYNCGPGNVRKAIARSGGKRDFWSIYPNLPRETRGYVPAYIGAFYVLEHHEDHNLFPRKIEFPSVVDTVQVKNAMTLNQISKVLNIPLKQVEDLNPQYKISAITKSEKGRTLYLPVNKISSFIALQDSIPRYKDSVNEDSIKIAKAKTAANYESSFVHYTIKSGDNLGLIADWFDVRLSDLRRWNNIYGTTIRAGRKLIVYVPDGKKDKYARINNMTFAQKQALSGKTVSASSAAKPKIPQNGNYQYHTVRSGDSLWSISQQYGNVTTDELKSLNGLTGRSTLHPGQKIIIKRL